MNDLPPDKEDANVNNGTPPENKPPNTWTELGLGLGVAAIAYLLPIIIVKTALLPNAIIGLAGLIFFAVAVLVNVKLFRSQHRIAAIALIIAMSPIYLAALLFGACSVLFTVFR